jgi:hypothetical protein
MSNEHVNQFILTSGVDNQLFTKIIVAGRDEETQEWNELAQWNDQNFQYAQQSKIFAINLDIIYKYYKIDIVGTQSINLAEISLLNFSNK